MNTIYLDRAMWTERAVGENAGPDLPECREAGERENNVVDFAAWKAENLVEFEEEPESGLREYQGRELVRRHRDRYEAMLARGELAATLSVVCAMLALVVRVLIF